MGTGRPTTVPNGNRRGDSARPSTRPLDYLELEGGGRDFASARLTPAAYEHGSALALPEAVVSPVGAEDDATRRHHGLSVTLVASGGLALTMAAS